MVWLQCRSELVWCHSHCFCLMYCCIRTVKNGYVFVRSPSGFCLVQLFKSFHQQLSLGNSRGYAVVLTTRQRRDSMLSWRWSSSFTLQMLNPNPLIMICPWNRHHYNHPALPHQHLLCLSHHHSLWLLLVLGWLHHCHWQIVHQVGLRKRNDGLHHWMPKERKKKLHETQWSWTHIFIFFFCRLHTCISFYVMLFLFVNLSIIFPQYWFVLEHLYIAYMYF